MSIIYDTIYLKRGLDANLPALAYNGEPLWTTDTHRLFVGTGTGVKEIAGTEDLWYVTPEMFGDVDGVNDEVQIQAAIDSGAAAIQFSAKQYNVEAAIKLKPTLTSLVGVSKYSTILKFTGSGNCVEVDFSNEPLDANGHHLRMTATVADSMRLRGCVFSNFQLQGSGSLTERCGFDISGISYSSFDNVRCYGFYQDGWYANGAVEIPVTIDVDGVPTSMTYIVRQVSNNTFNNCDGMYNGGRTGSGYYGCGFMFDDEFTITGGTVVNNGLANSALVFNGGNFSGNNFGIQIKYGYRNQFYGTCPQGNTYSDIKIVGGKYNSFIGGYMEGVTRGIYLGTTSLRNEVSIASNYPLWNSYVDYGTQNRVDINSGDMSADHVFNNPYFLNGMSGVSFYTTSIGNGTQTILADSDSPSGQTLELAITSDCTVQGIFFETTLDAAKHLGDWLTLCLDMKVDGVTTNTFIRGHAYIGTDQYALVASSSIASEYVGRGWDDISSYGDGYRKFYYDVRIPSAGTVCLPSLDTAQELVDADSTLKVFVKMFLKYTSATAPVRPNVGAATYYIRSAHIVKGQTSNISMAPIQPILLSGTAAANTITPRFIGDEYLLTSGPTFYKATGLTTSDWVALN